MITYLDACPACDPGFAPGAPPLGPVLVTDRGEVTDHECVICRTAWSTLWSGGWPVEQFLAPVAETRSRAA